MSRAKMIVTVDGGCVQEIVADQAVEIVLVDWDNLRAGDRPGPFPVTVDRDRVRKDWNRLAHGGPPIDDNA